MSQQLTLDGHMARTVHHPGTPALPLRPYQREAIDAVNAAEMTGVTRSLIALPTGCHQAGQEILMHDGSIWPVDDVRVGDRLMGPDGQPRMVLALARGTGPMMEIRPVKGTPWVVNDEHILTLVETQEKRHGRYPSQRGGTIRDVALPDWWQWSKNRKHRHKLFHVPVDFPEREAPPLDPYFLGVVLGDGSLAVQGRVSVTNIDVEVIDHVATIATSYGLHLRRERDAYHIVGQRGQSNPILDILRRLGLSPIACEDRFIPGAYKLGSREIRRQVLAGLLDTDGSLSCGGYDYSSKSEALADGVAFIARSLGLAAHVTKRPLGHYRVSISGHCSLVPCRIPRKQAPARAQKKDVLRTDFQVIPTGTVEPYYGFTLSGDGRYLLDDFTVIHNSGKSVIAAHQIAERGCRALFIAHRDELLSQAAGKLHQVAPGLEVGVVKAERDEVGADVVFASIQTLARPSRLARTLTAGDFGLIIVDEAHHCHIGGTLVETPAGPRPIEALQPGDTVLAWDGSAFVPRSVIRTYRHWYDGPIHEITTASGRSVQVTPNHRLYSNGERVHASAIRIGDHLSMRPVWLDDAEAAGHCDAHPLAPPGVQALPGVLGGPIGAEVAPTPEGAPAGTGFVHELRSGIRSLADWRAPGELPRQEPHATAGGARRSNAQAERECCLSGAIGDSHAGPEPHATVGASREDDDHDPWQGRSGRDGSLWGTPLRQWSASDTGRGSGPAALPGCSARVRGEGGGRRAALSLQARPGLAITESGPRTGRVLAWPSETPGGGPAQGCPAACDRLDDPASPQRGGALRGDRVVAVRVRHHRGWVYDLEVAEHHNYLANGILSSNSTAATYVAVLEALGGMRDDGAGPLVVGYTATPERGDRVGLGQVWQQIAYSRSILQMITEGYLVDARGLLVTTPADLASLRTSHGDFVDAEVGAELVRSGALGSIAEAYATNARDRKGVAFVPTVETAYALAEAMRAEGIRAEGIDGTTAPEQRRAILGRLRSGETQVACNAMLLCLDAETEILTDQGWTGIDQMTEGHQVANWDEGRIFFERPLEVVRRPRAPGEDMVYLETPRRSIRVTGGHRMLYRVARNDVWGKVAARDLVGWSAELPTCGDAEPSNIAPEQPASLDDRQRRVLISKTAYNLRQREGYEWDASFKEARRRVERKLSLRRKALSKLTLAECALIGFWVGDGSANYPQRSGIEYTLVQSTTYPAIIQWIDETIAATGVHAIRRTMARREGGNPFVRWSLGRGTGGGSQERSGVFGIEPYLDKNGSPLLWGLDDKQFDAFMLGLWYADGQHGKGEAPPSKSLRVANTNFALLSHLQAIAACRGLTASILGPRPVVKSNHAPLYELAIHRRRTHRMTTALTGSVLRQEDGWREERVWCVKTTSRNIVTRRRGTVTAMGNTEGWDEPSISCVLMARPTRSRALYIQCAGRGLRLYPGKTDCLILDVAGVTARLDLVTVADLAGLKKGEVEGRTITEAIAAREEREQAERRKGEALKVATATAATSLFRSTLRWIQAGAAFVLAVDGGVVRLSPEEAGETWRVERDLRTGRSVVAEGLSLEYAQGVGEDQVRQLGADHLARADAPWRERPATDKQLDLLRSWGVPIPEGATRGWASDQITPRLGAGPRSNGSRKRRR